MSVTDGTRMWDQGQLRRVVATLAAAVLVAFGAACNLSAAQSVATIQQPTISSVVTAAATVTTMAAEAPALRKVALTVPGIT